MYEPSMEFLSFSFLSISSNKNEVKNWYYAKHRFSPNLFTSVNKWQFVVAVLPFLEPCPTLNKHQVAWCDSFLSWALWRANRVSFWDDCVGDHHNPRARSRNGKKADCIIKQRERNTRNNSISLINDGRKLLLTSQESHCFMCSRRWTPKNIYEHRARPKWNVCINKTSKCIVKIARAFPSRCLILIMEHVGIYTYYVLW